MVQLDTIEVICLILLMRVGNAGQMLLTKKRFEKVKIWFISNVSEGEGQDRGYIGVEQ